MSKEAMLPCFVCGQTLQNVTSEVDNQPYEGTEFRTYGHYGSTFWDSFDGEELVLIVCDECLKKGTARLAQHKRYLPIKCDGVSGMGRQWVDRPMVSYTGNSDDGLINMEPEELGADLPRVEWADNIDQLKTWAIERSLKEDLTPSREGA